MAKQNITVTPDKLGDEIGKMFKEYTDEVIREMPDVVKKVAQDTVKDLKGRAGKLFGGKKYKKSFKSKKLATLSGKASYTIYSSEYRLTHLLENGHAIKNQTGKIYGKTKARPHWAPAEEKAVKDLEKKLTETI